MPMDTLYANNRNTLIQDALQEDFDLIVIGGGITGAGIALDASLRGIRTLLVEKKDFAFGTSSRSTKLIHGGLRYLKNMELSLVRELGIERAIVHKIAPHLTVPEKMLTPIVKNGTYGKLLSSIGIWLYDYLAGVKKEERRKMLGAKATKKAEPLLREDILEGSALYYEYRTDDARLTLEIIKTAAEKGALCLNYTELTNFTVMNKVIEGVVCKDVLTGRTLNFKGKVVVNAAGPWVDTIRSKDEKVRGKHLHLTKGVHLVVAHEKLPVQQAVYFDVFDGRMIFVIPRGKITYFGTTDTDYKGDLDHPVISVEDAEYLLKGVNYMFPSLDLKKFDIISGWAGLRPLIHEDSKSASEISRKDEIFTSEHGLISIAGGKLTGYRKMAERVTDKVSNRLFHLTGKSFKKADTSRQILAGGAFSNYEAVTQKIKQTAQFLKPFFEDADKVASRLTHLYGTQVDNILMFYQTNTLKLPPQKALLRAELQFCVENEAVYQLDDFFVRRTGILYFEPLLLTLYLDEAGLWLEEFISKKPNEILAEKNLLRQLLKEVSTF